MPVDAAADRSSMRLALDHFLRGVESRALRMAELSCGSRDDALELVQEAMFGFVRAYATRPAAEWSVLFWRVLDSRLTDFQRRRRVRSRWIAWLGPRDEDEADEDPLARLPDPSEPGPLARLGDEQAMQRLEVALRQLPLRQRQAFLLRVWDGLDVAQTAQAMSLSEGSVKTHLFRALHRLREQLESNHEH